jgi:uncharacterized membrane protein
VGKKSPKTQQANNLAGIGALDGAFWGMLFGLIFFVPFFGLAIGAAMGALAGSFADVGIDDNFIKQVRGEVTEGTSALFVMTTGAVVERVVPAIQALNPEIIATNLSADDEAALRERFGAQPGDAAAPADTAAPAAMAAPAASADTAAPSAPAAGYSAPTAPAAPAAEYAAPTAPPTTADTAAPAAPSTDAGGGPSQT